MRKIMFASLLFFGHYLAIAQGFYNKGAQISLTPQTILAVPDSLVNTGTLTNNGDIRIAGAWINTGTYDAGAGQINFNSDLTQTINHNAQSMGRLVISGGGQKQFLADITIESQLLLQSGKLISGNGAKIILKEGVVVSGASDASYVLGPVQWQGKGNWIFPIGNSSTYLPVAITNVTDGAAIATVMLHELMAGETLTGDSELAKLSTKRYWEVILGGGSIAASTITLPVSEEEDVTDSLNLLVVAASNSAMASYISLGQAGVTGSLSSGSVTGAQSPAFTFFTVAAISGERDIEIFNGVSPNGDNANDYMRISNIEFYPDNEVKIFNRWGDAVFIMSGYDNNQKNFKGSSSITGSKLPAGVYFYAVELKDGSLKRTGYLVVK